MHPPRKPTSAVEFEQVLQHVQVIVDNEQQRKELLKANGNNAQEWLDLFQLLADYPNNTTILRSWIFKLMIRLSRRSGLHPQCLTIQNVEKLGNYPVGGGSFGDVWKGQFRKRLVCLKVIRAFETSDVQLILKDYMQEAIIWRQLDHPNLLPFMGIYYLDTEQRQLCLVSPWMEKGNLVQFLRNTSRDLVDHDSLAYDVARGLSYLHAKDIVHGDLKGVNILITPDLRACIGDFGLSRISATQLLLSETSRSKGTTRWLAPELLRPFPSCMPSKQSDVYAYACVCYEIFTGRVPFHELAEAAIVLAVVFDRRCPSRPEDCAALRDWMWDMMVQCWNEIPSSRPTMAGNMSNMYEMIRNCRLGLPYDRSEPSFAQTQNVHDPQCSQVTRAVNATRPYDIGDDNLRTVFGTPVLSGQNSIQESHVIYYFENVWPVHSLLGATLNTTFELILKDPRGALTNAVCALANLHYTQLRVAQGLDAPDPNSEHSTAKYFYDEAYFQIVNAKQLRGSYTVGDAFTALHLICYSQLSGGSTDWITMLDVMFDWIAQSDLLNGDDPSVTLETMMSAFEQCGIKCVMMIDIMSSLTLMRPPKYFNLYQRLLGSNENSGAPLHFGGMQLELLSTCPGEAWLAIAEVSVLSSWKASEERKGSLSLREFIRRADDIERRLRFNTNKSTAFQADSPLAQNLHLGDVTRRLISEIFRETALLYLHTVMTSPPSVGGPEITSSVGRLVKMLRQLAPSSEIDRTLIFPMCLAGCMTDHPNHRAFLKGRLQALDNTIGNTSNVRLLMEGVWQRRGDQTVHHVDWREAMQDRSLNLLLI